MSRQVNSRWNNGETLLKAVASGGSAAVIESRCLRATNVAATPPSPHIAAANPADRHVIWNADPAAAPPRPSGDPPWRDSPGKHKR